MRRTAAIALAGIVLGLLVVVTTADHEGSHEGSHDDEEQEFPTSSWFATEAEMENNGTTNITCSNEIYYGFNVVYVQCPGSSSESIFHSFTTMYFYFVKQL